MSDRIPKDSSHIIGIEKHLDAFFPEQEEPRDDPDEQDFPEVPFIDEEVLYRLHASIRNDVFDLLQPHADAAELKKASLPAMLDRAFAEGYGLDKEAAYRLARLSLQDYERKTVQDLALPLLLYRRAGDRENVLFCAELAAHATDIEDLRFVEDYLGPAEFRRLAGIAAYVFLYEDIRREGSLDKDNAVTLVRATELCVRHLDVAALEIVYDLCKNYASPGDEGMQMLLSVINGEHAVIPPPMEEDETEPVNLEEYFENQATAVNVAIGLESPVPSPSEFLPPEPQAITVYPNRVRGEDHAFLEATLAYDEKKSDAFRSFYEEAAARFEQ